MKEVKCVYLEIAKNCLVPIDRSTGKGENRIFSWLCVEGEHRRKNVYVQRICKCGKVIVRWLWSKAFTRLRVFDENSGGFYWTLFGWELCSKLAFAEKVFLNIHHAIVFSKRAANIQMETNHLIRVQRKRSKFSFETVTEFALKKEPYPMFACAIDVFVQQKSMRLAHFKFFNYFHNFRFDLMQWEWTNISHYFRLIKINRTINNRIVWSLLAEMFIFIAVSNAYSVVLVHSGGVNAKCWRFLFLHSPEFSTCKCVPNL